MTLSLLQEPVLSFEDASGRPLFGGKLHTYAAGTLTLKATFQDQGGTIPNTNPITLNARGEATVYGSGNYRMILKDKNGVTIWDRDNVSASGTAAEALRTDLGNSDDGSKGDALIAVKQPFGGATARTQHDKNAEDISVTDFGAAPSNSSSDNVAAFIAAEAASSGAIYVPDGTFKLTSPMDLGQKCQYYGPGVLQFDKAEWWRRGGSSGSVSVPERYTLFYEYDSQSQVSLLYNDIPQTFTWVDFNTIEGPGSLVTDQVKIVVANGTLHLGAVPQYVRAYNMVSSGAKLLNPVKPDVLTVPKGYFNAAYGPRALQNIREGINNTAVGALALLDNLDNINQTAVGFQALYRSRGDGNTAVGSIAGEWLLGGTYNSLLGLSSGGKLRDGSYNVAVGYQALAESLNVGYSVAIGHRAFGNSGETFSPNESVAVGAFAGDFARGLKNTLIGYRAGCGPNSGSDGNENVFVGFFAGRNQNGADFNVGLGVSAAASLTSGQYNALIGHGAGAALANSDNNVAVGAQALGASTTGNGMVAIGFQAGKALSASGSVAIGNAAATNATSADSLVVIGNNAGVNLTTGNQNTIVGANAGRFDYSGNPSQTVTNCSILGYDARVSGSNQVQLGNSATTTYVYGTVQNRSDARDKADVRDTNLGLTFIEKLRPVDFRWDYRDDYVRIDEDGTVTTQPKDGSRKRVRFHHGLIAQEVKAVMDELGIEFGGYQDHTVLGGCDVQTIGYDELIGPLIKAVQELSARVKNLESKF